MLFCELEFFGLFLPIVFFLHWVVTRYIGSKFTIIFLVFASLIFYASWKIEYLLLLLGSISINWFIANKLIRDKKKWFLSFSICLNLLPLFIFKYYDFFCQTTLGLFSKNYDKLNLILPLGISFFTFQQITFLVQCFRDKKSDINFNGYVLYITFFPQLIAGPIVYLSEFKKSIESIDWLKWNGKNITDGIFLFCIGLFKKLVLADTFSMFADTTFSSSVDSLNSSSAWIGAVSYYFQLYFDFSGYCDMAMGAALLFNIKLPLNFNSPYKALNIQDFWRRWHITLSRWLKDFIYIPLGGNRSNHWKTISNVVVVFLIGGIWHGANWTFIVWGLLHGIGIAIFIFWRKTNYKLPRFLSYMITQVFILLLWVVFRSDNIIYSQEYLSVMFGLEGLLNAQNIYNEVCISYLSLSYNELNISDMYASVFFYWLTITSASFYIVKYGYNYSLNVNNNIVNSEIKKGCFSGFLIFGIILLTPKFHESPFIYFNF